MAKLSQRFFAIFFAVLFLITSSFVAIAFIIANVQSKDNSKSSKGSSTSQSVTNKTNSSTSKSNPSEGPLSGFTPVSQVSELKTTDLTVGSGKTVNSGDTVCVDYSGAVAATGTIFQSSSSPLSLSLNQVIVGWQKGIPGMKEGGTRQILIPANMAYGANPPSGSGIPPNAALVFNVTVKPNSDCSSTSNSGS